MSKFLVILFGFFACTVSLLASQALVLAQPIQHEALAMAARKTILKEIDYLEEKCANDRSVEQWLQDLTGNEARSIRWSGGACQLIGPGPLDTGSHWCGQATVILKHPKNKDDKPMIEIFFEKPVKGHPGKAYAFRGSMLAADGLNYSRFRWDFEWDWRSRFPTSGIVPEACKQEDGEAH
jgi:hypothetical protein